ncbi:unnamed protein product [Prunus armeniaca]|uniref:Uncharacterized protein n=1 Tax=Prunus armeniaca TaxID=36596 RepID=A0A6J5UNI2_PRUAR|nr:unnamed protein product [Prunus armeniaca]
MVTRAKSGIHKPNPKYAHTSISLSFTDNIVEPTCFTQANKVREWGLAVTDEFNALQKGWYLGFRASHISMNVLPNKWVFRLKRNSDGSIQRYKA